MKLGNSNLNRVITVAAILAATPLLTAGACDDAKDAACADYSCASKGVAEGNFAISGNVAIDSFFKSVVNFGSTANGVAADIKAELDGIQLAFGVTDAELKTATNLGAAIAAKLEGNATITVDAQPAKCEVNAQVTAQATLDCQASAECDVSGGKASVQCMGTCTVEASAEGKCDAMAVVSCEVSGPELTCMGECSGSCTLDASAGIACEGTCNGMCSGTCSVMNGDGSCAGACDGMCTGSCEVGGMAALDCQGTCNGSCKYKPAMASCEANAKVSCEFKAEAKAECSGSCDGEFEPPKVDCEASASCEASAKAEAKFQAKCEPPSVDVRIEFAASASAEVRAQLQFAVSELKVRLPRLKAAIAKADLVVEAGAQLTSDGKAAVEGTIDGLANGDIDVAAAWKIGKCVPAQLDASAGVITESGKNLAARVEAAASLTSTFGG